MMKRVIFIFVLFTLFFGLASCKSKEKAYESLESKTFSFYVGEEGNFDRKYDYKSSDSSVIKIKDNKYITLKEGSAYVTVHDGNSKVGVYLIAVYGSKPIILEELIINNSPSNNLMTVGDKIKLVYEKNPLDANDYDALIWESSDQSIAKIDKYGNLEALKMGEVVISLKAEGTDVVKEIQLTINPRETIFEINHKRIIGIVGTREEVLESNVLTDYSFDGNIRWYSENENIVTVDSNGVTSFINEGSTNICIEATIDGKKVTSKCQVDVLCDEGYEIIRTPEELQAIGNNSGNYMLGNDIDMTYEVSPLGSLYNDGKGFMPLFEDAKNSFKGIFDGNGFKIINMYINRPNDTFVAFMRYISSEKDNEGLIKRLSFVGGSITGGNYTSVFYANASGYGSINSGLRDSYAEMTLSSIGSLSCLVGNNKGLVSNCISNVKYDALGDMYLFALNQTSSVEGIGINNCIFIGDYENVEFVNLNNGGFSNNCAAISLTDVSNYEFDLGNNWKYILGQVPVVKGGK